MANPAPTINQINAFNATQGTIIDFNIIGGTELVRSNKIYIYDLSDNSLICTHLYVSTESIHELPANTDGSIVYESGKSSADFVNGKQYYAQIQTFTDIAGTQGGSGLSVSKLFWCLVDPSLTIDTIPSSISTTSYNVSATYDANTSVVSNIIQQYQFNLYSATGSLLQSSGVVVGNGEQQGTSTAYDISYNFSGLSVGSSYYVVVNVTTTQGMSISAQSSTFTVSIDTPTLGEATVVNNACDGYISVTSNLSSEYGGSASGEVATFETDSVNNVTKLEVELDPIQDGTPWQGTDVDSEPYQFRAMPQQSNDYNREYDTLVGGTVNWNQLIENGNFETKSTWSTVSCTWAVSNNIATLTKNSSPNAVQFYQYKNVITDHKYLMYVTAKASSACKTAVRFGSNYTLEDVPANVWVEKCVIRNASVSASTELNFVSSLDVENETLQIKNFGCVDLTAFFGNSVTADYVYSLEQANAGAGIAWLRKYFPDLFAYSPYDTGTLKSVKPTAHVTRGVNQWDEQWETGTYNTITGEEVTNSNRIRSKNLIPVIPNTTYYFADVGTYTSWIQFFWYDGNKNFINNTNLGGTNRTFTIPNNAYYLNFGTSDGYGGAYKNDICINISNADLNGKYYPAEHHTYPISELELRGIPKLVDGELRFDGDTRKASGSNNVQRRHAVIDMGTIAWSLWTGDEENHTFVGSGIPQEVTNSQDIICEKYPSLINGSTQWAAILPYDKVVYRPLNGNYFIVRDTAYSEKEAFKAAMNGVKLQYPLATPTTETADPFTSPQVCNPYGTEEYVTTNIVPVGHQSRYALVCPITGHDEVEAKIAGKNLIDPSQLVVESWSSSTIDDDIITLVWTNGSVQISGKQTFDAGTYTIHAIGTNLTNAIVGIYNRATGSAIYNALYLNANRTINVSVPFYIIIYGYYQAPGTAVFKLQMEKGSTATDYVPYVDPIEVSQSFNVTLTPTVIDETPYLFKKTGDVRGDRESLELIGGAVCVNQLLDGGNFPNLGAWSKTSNVTASVSNNVATIKVGSTTEGYLERANVPKIAGHKYMVMFETRVVLQPLNSAWVFRSYYNGTSRQLAITLRTNENKWTKYVGIFAPDTSSTGYSPYRFACTDANAEAELQVRNCMLIDLTQMFGSAIANYIYELQTNVDGSGVAKLKEWGYFTESYIPYNTGTLESVKPTAHVTRGVNQWDEEWESGIYGTVSGNKGANANYIRNVSPIRIVPNTTYYVKFNAVEFVALYYDANGTYTGVYQPRSSSNTLSIPQDAYYMNFYVKNTVYANDICINISDPDLNGKYFPADHHTYPITELELRGIPKLVDGELRFDGDMRKADGSNNVNRKYILVDLGTLNYGEYGSTDSVTQYYTTGLDSIVAYSALGISSKFVYDSEKNPWTMAVTSMGQGRTYFRTSKDYYASTTAFKTAMSGVYAVFERMTPTTETAEPFADPQEVSIYGTEEFVSSNGVPVGNKTTYKTRDIFGGKIDLASGVLTVTKKGILLDGSADENWGLSGSSANNMYYLTVDNIKNSYAICGIVCNRLQEIDPTIGYSRNDINGVSSWGSNDSTVRVCLDTSVVNRSVTDFKTWLSNNPLFVVYPVAEPLTYQLTPYQIETLIGTNNVWSNAGDVSIEFHIPITNLLVKRQDVDDVSGNWLTLYSQPVEQASDMDFTFIDYLNQYGKTYKYALVPLLTQTQSGVEVEVEGGYTVSDEVQSIFDGVYIGDSTGVQRLKAGVAYNNLNTNQQVGVIPTLGNKYPIIVSNGNIQYDTGSVSGLIVPDDFYSNGNLSRLDMSDKREVINDFLINKKPKILKDWNGNIWLVVFTDNVDVSFDNNYGMGIATFTSGWTEVGDPTNQEDLQKTGLINVGGD